MKKCQAMTIPQDSPTARELLTQERADWEAAFTQLSLANRSLFFANFGGYFALESSDPPSDDIPVDKICEELASDLFAEFGNDFACDVHGSSGSSGVEIMDFD
jgi:hypothetical protein